MAFLTKDAENPASELSLHSLNFCGRISAMTRTFPKRRYMFKKIVLLLAVISLPLFSQPATASSHASSLKNLVS